MQLSDKKRRCLWHGTKVMCGAATWTLGLGVLFKMPSIRAELLASRNELHGIKEWIKLIPGNPYVGRLEKKIAELDATTTTLKYGHLPISGNLLVAGFSCMKQGFVALQKEFPQSPLSKKLSVWSARIKKLPNPLAKFLS